LNQTLINDSLNQEFGQKKRSCDIPECEAGSRIYEKNKQLIDQLKFLFSASSALFEMSLAHLGSNEELRPRKTNHLADRIFVMLSDDSFDGEWGLGWIRLLFFLFRE
jgi:hypothetical protein